MFDDLRELVLVVNDVSPTGLATLVILLALVVVVVVGKSQK